MRILQVSNSLATGGAEKLIIDYTPKIVEKGVEMDVLVLNGDKHPFLEKLEKTGCCKIFSLTSKSVYNPFLVFKLIPFLKKYDLIHVHLFPALYWVSIAKLISFSKTKIVYTEHSTYNRRRGNWLFSFLDRIVYHQYQKIIVVSEQVKASLQDHLPLKSTRFEIIPNGIAIDSLKNVPPHRRADFNLNNDDNLIIQVSRFSKQKNQTLLIKAIPHMKTPVRLLFVGDGKYIEDSKALVKKLHMEDQVLFLGVRMDVDRLLKMSDVFVLSSHYEGLSISSLEAMASGIPVIASDVPGLNDLVKGYGILFPKGDEKLLALEIDRLFEDSEYYRKTAQSCMDRAEQFSITNTIQKHYNLYREICLNPS